LDGDGKPDAVVTNKGDGTIALYLGDGAGHLVQAATVTVAAAPSGVLLADLDDDGLNDIVVTHSDGSLTILLTGNPPFTPIPTETPIPTDTATPTDTPIPTETGTETNTPTCTPTATGTITATATGTATQTGVPTGTVTHTFGGFDVMGKGCADIGGAGALTDAMPFIILALLLALRSGAQRTNGTRQHREP